MLALRLFSHTLPSPSPGLQGLCNLTALPHVTQIRQAFASPVKTRLALGRLV